LDVLDGSQAAPGEGSHGGKLDIQDIVALDVKLGR